MRTFLLMCLLTLGLMCGTGCKRKPTSLENAVALAASPTGGRVAAAAQLATDIAAKTVDLDAAVSLAFDQLEALKNGAPTGTAKTVPKSADATAFAGAVLDAIERLGSKISMSQEKEIFWQGVGSLACTAAEEADAAGRLAEARALCFAGGQRWQNAAFWHYHPTFDAVVSVILWKSGEQQEARQRLSERAELKGKALEVYEMMGGRQ